LNWSGRTLIAGFILPLSSESSARTTRGKPLFRNARNRNQTRANHVRSNLCVVLKADAPNQASEARVGAQRVVNRLYLQIDQVRVTFLICLLQPLERLIFFSQADMNHREEHTIALPVPRIGQAPFALHHVGPLTHGCIRVRLTLWCCRGKERALYSPR
jgi:hypothetical protein